MSEIDQVRELLAQERNALAQEREALAREREALLTAIGEAVGGLLDKQYERIRSEMENSVKARQAEITTLQHVVAELRQLIAADRAVLIEPNPLRRTN